MRDWFAAAATWVRSGEGRDGLRAALPRPPVIGALPAALPAALERRVRGRASLYALLARQANDLLDAALPRQARPTPPERVLGSRPLAAG